MPGSAPIIAALRRHPELDPRAVLAVAAQEGLGGGIGDSGHAFGPFQLNNAGGVITGRFQGQTPQQINQWAWSPQGLEYALSRISGVAAGQRGPQAINSIVRRFERPADPDSEVARALGGTGGQVGGGAAQPLSAGPAVAAVPDRHAFAMQLLSAISPTGQLGDQGSLVKALQARQAAPAAQPAGAYAPSALSAAAAGRGGGIAELLKEGVGGPTHSTGPHIHAAFNDPQLELAAIGYAQKLGLHVGENPYVGDTVDPVHAPNSFHTRLFPGRYQGRRLGQAIDVSGGNTDAFYSWLAGRKR